MAKQQLLKKNRGNNEVPDPTQGSQDVPGVDDLQVCIAHRAYELYEQGRCCHGHDLDHWLEAEREVLKVESEKEPESPHKM